MLVGGLGQIILRVKGREKGDKMCSRSPFKPHYSPIIPPYILKIILKYMPQNMHPL